MKRAQTFAAITLALWPASAFAQQSVPTHWSAIYAGPIYAAGGLLLLGLGHALSVPGWNRLGVFLWLLIVTAGGCFAIYALPGIVLGAIWQLLALVVAFVLFVALGQDALTRLQRD
jgi:hypothetical protein